MFFLIVYFLRKYKRKYRLQIPLGAIFFTMCYSRRMRDEEDLIDITFACEGKKIGAHKLVLFSCSPYFKDLLKENKSQHPIFFFHDISYEILKAILEYMYLGEVHITNDNLKDFIRVAEALQIRGLSKDTSTTVSNRELHNDTIFSNQFIPG